jgi:hypothetical protein
LGIGDAAGIGDGGGIAERAGGIAGGAVTVAMVGLPCVVVEHNVSSIHEFNFQN